MHGLEELAQIDRLMKSVDRWVPSPKASSENSSGPGDLTFEAIFRDALLNTDDASGVPSPLQLAIIRASQGLELDGCIGQDGLLKHFGTANLGEVTPKIVVLVCGVRGGKSKLAVCRAINGSMFCDLTGMLGTELPRYSIVGPDIDTASATFRDLVSIVESIPRLAARVHGEPTADSVTLRRPDGRLVEIKVVAASKGGRTVRNRWLAGLILEEVAQIGAELEGAAVSAEAIMKAARPRLLGQAWLISSPYGPQGMLYDEWKKHFGHPGDTLVVHADTLGLNPSYPRERIEAERVNDPDNAAREYDAEWLDAATAYYETKLIERATRKRPVEAVPGLHDKCWAAGDFATRGNAWTVSVSCGTVIDGGIVRVRTLAAWQWVGSKTEPLSPRRIFAELAELLGPYRVRDITCDAWSFDANQDHAKEVGLHLTETEPGQQNAAYAKLKTLLASCDVELPPVAEIPGDLKGVRKIANAGSVRIVLSKQASGRHCDFAPSVSLSAAMAADNPSVGNVIQQLEELNDYSASRWQGYGDRGFG